MTAMRIALRAMGVVFALVLSAKASAASGLCIAGCRSEHLKDSELGL